MRSLPLVQKNPVLTGFSSGFFSGWETLGPFIREKISRERNYLYEYKLPGQDKPRLEKAVNVDFVPFIRGVRGLRKPRPELAAAYFLSYKRPY